MRSFVGRSFDLRLAKMRPVARPAIGLRWLIALVIGIAVSSVIVTAYTAPSFGQGANEGANRESNRIPGPGPDSGPGRPQRDEGVRDDKGVGANRRRGQAKSNKDQAAKPPKPIPKSLRRPGRNAVPEGASQRAALLRELYAHLATTLNETVAQRTASAIEQVWKTSGSETVTLLMNRSIKAANDSDNSLALSLLERAIRLAPDYTEVFFQRAMINYSAGNFRPAVGDLRRVLALDPNHYKALEVLGQIMKEIDRKKDALAVLRRLYEVYPLRAGVKSSLEELEREVEGQPT